MKGRPLPSLAPPPLGEGDAALQEPQEGPAPLRPEGVVPDVHLPQPPVLAPAPRRSSPYLGP